MPHLQERNSDIFFDILMLHLIIHYTGERVNQDTLARPPLEVQNGPPCFLNSLNQRAKESRYS